MKNFRRINLSILLTTFFKSILWLFVLLPARLLLLLISLLPAHLLLSLSTSLSLERIIYIFAYTYFFASVVCSLINFKIVVTEVGLLIGILILISYICINYILPIFGRLQWKYAFSIMNIQIITLIANKVTGNNLITVLSFSPSLILFCFGLLGNIYLIYLRYSQPFYFFLNKNYNDFPTKKTLLNKIFPEEYSGELKAFQKRWKKQGLTKLNIKLNTFFCVLDMIWALLRCKIENIWLDKNRIE